MRRVSDETLTAEVKTLFKEGRSVNWATKVAFHRHGIFDRPRFGRICQAVEKALGISPPASLKVEQTAHAPYYYETGQYA